MASLGRWSGGVTSLVPTTSWTAPASLVTTEDRNDGAAYGYDAATSTITLPGSDLADGYLIVGAYQTSGGNNRTNPSARWVQTSGTGNFLSAVATGYSRDTSNDNSYVRTWAVVDGPSLLAQVQFQYRRDSNVANTGTVEAYFEIIPLYYSNIAMLSSTNGTVHGGTTPTQITGFSAVVDTGGIFASDQVTLADGKKYLCLGGWYYETSINSRTQRWGGFRLNGTKLDSAKGYAYLRNNANGHIGEIVSHALTSGVGDTMDMFLYRGDGVANGDGGADVDGGTTSDAAAHAMVFLELDDGAEFVADTNAAQSATYTGSAASIGASVTAPNTSDYLVGADISGASFVNSTGTRYQGESEITVAGTAQGHTVSGDYLRNNQGSQDTFGWSSNNLSAVAATASDAITAVVNQTGQNGGNPASPAGWVGLFAIDLDTLQGSSTSLVNSDLESIANLRSSVSSDSQLRAAIRQAVSSDLEFPARLLSVVSSDNTHLANVLVNPAVGTVYWAIYPSSTADPDAATIIAQSDGSYQYGSDTSPTVTTAGFQGASLTGLTAGTEYKLAAVWDDGSGTSNVAISSPFTTTGGAVTVSSDLQQLANVRELLPSDLEFRSALREGVASDLSFIAGVKALISADVAFLSNILGLVGRLYWAVYPSATADPDGPTIIAQSDGSYLYADDLAPETTTASFQGALFSGLTSGTEYKLAAVWHDGVKTSNVAISPAFTTTGGFTAVNSDLEFRASVLELLQADSSHLANVRESLSAELEAISNIRELTASDMAAIANIAELVGANLAAPADIAELVGSEAAFLANVRELIASDLEQLFDVLSLSTAAANLVLAYNIAEHVQSDSAQIANVAELTGANVDLVSNIAEMVSQDADFVANIRELAGASLESLYDIITSLLVASDLAMASNVRELVGEETAFPSRLLELVNQDSEFISRILVSVAQDAELVYRIAQHVFADSEMPYSLKELATADLESRFNVLIILTDRLLKEDGGLLLVRLLHETQTARLEHKNALSSLLHENRLSLLEIDNDLRELLQENDLIQMDKSIH